MALIRLQQVPISMVEELSSQAHQISIVEKNNKLHLVLGSPGGPTIITSVLQTILNFEDFNFNIKKAVNSPRFYHLWLPDLIYYESKAIVNKDKDSLLEKGYYLNNYPSSINKYISI